MKKNTLYNFSLCSILLSMVVLFLNSCREDFDFIEAYRANPQYVYKENFENAFGKIDPNQSWDFTQYGTATTRAAGDVNFRDESGINFEVNTTVNGTVITNTINTSSKNKQLYDKLNNKPLSGSLVSSFISNGEDFSILPVTTQCDYKYNMYIKVGDDTRLLFSKDWTDAGYAYCNQMATRISAENEKIGTWVDLEGTDQETTHKVFTINSKENASYYINHSNTSSSWKYLSTTFRTYALVDIAGAKYLLDVKTGQFLSLTIEYINIWLLFTTIKIPYPNLSVVNDISKASPVTVSGNYIMINGYYIYNNGKSYGLGVKTRLPWLGKTPYTWEWTPVILTNKDDIERVKKALTTTKPTPIKKALPGISVSGAPLGETVEIYIQKIDADGNEIEDGEFGSNNACVHELSGIPEIADLNDEDASEEDIETIRYFGIDGNNDRNYRDLVFAVIGKNNTVDQSVASKRYMVEDLGAVESSDIDFNDIVFDIESKYTIRGIVPSNTTQTAKVRALGGTLDIAIKIDDKEIFRKSTANNTILNSAYRDETVKSNLSKLETSVMYNTGQPGGIQKINFEDITTSKEATIATINLSSTTFNNPWDPATNNVKVLVSKSKEISSTLTDVSGQTYTEIGFPANGTVPAMIAVPTTQKWNYEKVDALHEHGKNGCYLKLQDLTSKPTASVNE